MSEFLGLTVAGLNIGAIYTVMALGWVVTYQVSRVYNLAQGGFVVVGALLMKSLYTDQGWSLPAAIAVDLVISLVLGAGLYLLTLNRFARRGPAAPIVMTVGAATLMSEGIRGIWGVNDLVSKPYLSVAPFSFAGAGISPQVLLIWGGTAALVMAGWLVFEYTLAGKAFRACAEGNFGARIVGLNENRIKLGGFMLSALFGSAGGILVAPVIAVGWDSVWPFAVLGLVATVFGSWRYLGGAAGGVALGLASSYCAGYLSSTWQNDFVYVAFLAALIVVVKPAMAH